MTNIKPAKILSQTIAVILAVICLASSISSIGPTKTAHALIDPAKLVQDKAGILSASEESSIANQLNNIETQTTAEIAVVTLPNLGGRPVEEVALETLRGLGIGKKDKNNGLLILIALEERQIRLEVGYGLEGDIPDSLAERISRTIIAPSFKAGRYAEGIANGVKIIGDILKADSTNGDRYGVLRDNGLTGSDNWGIANSIFNNINFLYFLGFIALILASYMSRTKSWWQGGVFGGIAGIIVTFIAGLALISLATLATVGGFIAFGLIVDYILSKHGPIGRRGRGGRNGIWFLGGGSGFGGSSGGFGGGGGGFGGGSGGGGGGGSSW